MRTLVIETATSACSVALIEDGRVLAAGHDVVGRGHAERLVPMIAQLPDGGRASAVLVDCGPGSFTGLRVGLAAGLGFGIGWAAHVAGYSSLALVAAAGFARHPGLETLAVVMEGGHGEVFMQAFAREPFQECGPFASLKPADALAALAGRLAIGDGVRHLPTADVEHALPDARDVLLLPPAMTTLPPRPIYGRAPDAKPNVDR